MAARRRSSAKRSKPLPRPGRHADGNRGRRPQSSLADFIATPEALRTSGAKLFDRIARGVLTPHIGQTFSLEQAAEAHRALEARETIGSTVLIP